MTIAAAMGIAKDRRLLLECSTSHHKSRVHDVRESVSVPAPGTPIVAAMGGSMSVRLRSIWYHSYWHATTTAPQFALALPIPQWVGVGSLALGRAPVCCTFRPWPLDPDLLSCYAHPCAQPSPFRGGGRARVVPAGTVIGAANGFAVFKPQRAVLVLVPFARLRTPGRAIPACMSKPQQTTWWNGYCRVRVVPVRYACRRVKVLDVRCHRLPSGDERMKKNRQGDRWMASDDNARPES